MTSRINYLQAVFTKTCFGITIICMQFGCHDSSTVYATRKNIIESVYASGKIIAENEHNLFAIANGTIIKKMTMDGDTVTKGQILFEINTTATTAGLNVSNDKVKFIQQFATNEPGTEKYCIRSDCDGIVYQTMKESGEAVRLNEPVVLIGDASKRIIRLSIDQQDINKISIGQQVLLKTDVTGDSIYKAAITKIYALMNESTQTFRVDASFTEAFDYPFIHNPVEANIIIKEKKEALVIPGNIIDGNDSLWTRLNGKAQKIKVSTGIKTPEYVEVLSGIDEKTPIIIK